IRFYSGKVVLTRGEVMLSKESDDPRLKKLMLLGKMNSRNVFNCTLTILGKTDLASNSIDIKKYDTRFADPELRKLVYNILNEDITMSYYDLAMKHGFDTSRLYNHKGSAEKTKTLKTDDT